MKPLTKPNDSLDASAQAGRNEIEIAREFQRAAEIVVTGRCCVVERLVAHIYDGFVWVRGVRSGSNYSIWIPARFERCEPDDGFEYRAGCVSALGRTIDLD